MTADLNPMVIFLGGLALGLLVGMVWGIWMGADAAYRNAVEIVRDICK
jgi:ABC-type nitrate/sulfonate/bicarbonate transport system permease component